MSPPALPPGSVPHGPGLVQPVTPSESDLVRRILHPPRERSAVDALRQRGEYPGRRYLTTGVPTNACRLSCHWWASVKRAADAAPGAPELTAVRGGTESPTDPEPEVPAVPEAGSRPRHRVTPPARWCAVSARAARGSGGCPSCDVPAPPRPAPQPCSHGRARAPPARPPGDRRPTGNP